MDAEIGYERLSMRGTRTMDTKSVTVFPGSIPFVPNESVHGICLIELHHHPVSRDLGHDRCRGNGNR